MYSLYHSLLAQHAKQLTPVRCAPATVGQLHRYFEDVVLENNLNALVIESFPLSTERSIRQIARLQSLTETARSLFLVAGKDDGLAQLFRPTDKPNRKSFLLERHEQGRVCERFVVIADARFSALLASIAIQESPEETGESVVWTFEPDVVYSALEYLMARVTAEHPAQASAFSEAVRVSMPKATSLQLTLGVTTKLAQLLQAQAEREIALNRIATSIRNSLDLEQILATAAREVSRALNANACAVRVEGKSLGRPMTKMFYRSGAPPDAVTSANFIKDVESLNARMVHMRKPYIVDGDHPDSGVASALAVIPLIFNGCFAGILLIRSDDRLRVWADNELLLLGTVADQLAVAVNQAHMYSQMQQQALTDGLTGWHNRRSFELQLERDLHLATRMRQPLSLIMMDLDNFKQINDNAGHETGDAALRMLAETLRAELRAVDTAARYGGDEFAIILPQANSEGAYIVAERLRRKIEQLEVPGFGGMTASFGLATFPVHASSRDTLVVAADRALYEAKAGGRNRISIPPDDCEDYSADAVRAPEIIESIQRT
jgi:diguanylate cyclase (GGDEF)-like protein